MRTSDGNTWGMRRGEWSAVRGTDYTRDELFEMFYELEPDDHSRDSSRPRPRGRVITVNTDRERPRR